LGVLWLQRFVAAQEGAFVIERRRMTRYDFGAIAEVIDLQSRDDVIAVTRDLSLSGCFVKTITPFPAGTEVRIRITCAGSDFAAIGQVTGNITREGMGIEFVEIEPEHQAIIEEWLSVTALKPGQVVRLRNRLSRQEQNRPVRSAGPKPKADRPRLLTDQLGSARNLWKFRDDARH
jgi:hypothetical protein